MARSVDRNHPFPTINEYQTTSKMYLPSHKRDYSLANSTPEVSKAM
jgi:hypothetical protein